MSMSWPPASHHRSPGLIPGQSSWDLWCLKWHWGFSFPLSVSFHYFSILIFVYRPLLPEGHRQNLETFKEQCPFRHHAPLDWTVLSVFLDSNGINMLTIRVTRFITAQIGSHGPHVGCEVLPSGCRFWPINRNAAIVFCTVAMNSFRTTGNVDPVKKCPIPEDLNPRVVTYKDTSHHSSFISFQRIDSS
jgi:hypothetical protein